MAPKVAIVFVREKPNFICLCISKEVNSTNNRVQYSTYGHVQVIAEAEQAGLKKAGIDADIFQ
jgi:hypothetical protein